MAAAAAAVPVLVLFTVMAAVAAAAVLRKVHLPFPVDRYILLQLALRVLGELRADQLVLRVVLLLFQELVEALVLPVVEAV